MNDLSNYLDGMYSSVQIDLRNEKWHRLGGIPNKSGWYYISTNAPISLIQQQRLWSPIYQKARDKSTAAVKNYDLQERAGRYTTGLSRYFSVRGIYSGLASNLLNRAREHTFADPGTAGLALSKYTALHDYEWIFHFVTLNRFMAECECEDFLLRFGEQLWRAKNGWPVLCTE